MLQGQGMNESTASSSAPSALPTLGDKPSSVLVPQPATPRKRRFGRKLTVATIAGLLVLAGATSAFAVKQDPFNDVGADNPFRSDVAWMSEHGIADGFPDGGYHPTAPVTRQAMAAFMHRLDTYLVPAVLAVAGLGGAASDAVAASGQ